MKHTLHVKDSGVHTYVKLQDVVDMLEKEISGEMSDETIRSNIKDMKINLRNAAFLRESVNISVKEE